MRSLSKEADWVRREKLISSYAIAQYHLGIEPVLKIKIKMFGSEYLNDVPLYKLEILIKRLRKLFKAHKNVKT